MTQPVLIDTHTHLYLDHFATDLDDMMARSSEAGVSEHYLPNIDSTSIEGMLALEKKYPGRCHAMMGLHPCSVKADYRTELETVRKWLEKRPFCAVGEIGIDLYWDKTFFEEQKTAFVTQARWAKDLGLPIVIHARESLDILIALVRQELDGRLHGIFHCFSGTAAQARQITDMGFFLGIGGVVTYKNGGLDKALEDVPLEHLVLETDSPYLAPVPFRGKRNESAYIKYVAEKLAAIKQVGIEEVAVATTANAKKNIPENSLTYTTVS